MKIKFFSDGVPDLSGVVGNQATLNKLRTPTPKIIFKGKHPCAIRYTNKA